ncbi:MAG: SMC-Scp complex subunit ScpB [Verrucomicrobiae bacterium]|nr:SMC-Scp complex subunit ScpB [Verrucomicrobiae bacterium]
MLEIKNILEAVLFASAKPLTAKDFLIIFRDAAEFEPGENTVLFKDITLEIIRDRLAELGADLEGSGRAFRLQVNGEEYKLATLPDYGPWVKQLFDKYKPQRLSPSALETLAIIAYRQPITRADVEAVRGVNVDTIVTTLVERGLVKISGRADLPGRPMLHETTQEFLDHFGLKSLEDMPNREELRNIPLRTAPVEPEPAEQQQELPIGDLPPADSPAPEPGKTPPADPSEPLSHTEEAPAQHPRSEPQTPPQMTPMDADENAV